MWQQDSVGVPMPVKLDAEGRRAQIMAAAMLVAARDGISAVTPRGVAKACRPACSPRTVLRVVGPSRILRREVAARARECGVAVLIAEAETLGL